MHIFIEGKEVDMRSLVVDGVDTRDYPDFVDAYLTEGAFLDGTPFNDAQMEAFDSEHGDVINELAHEKYR
jgi:hypothetical protein